MLFLKVVNMLFYFKIPLRFIFIKLTAIYITIVTLRLEINQVLFMNISAKKSTTLSTNNYTFQIKSVRSSDLNILHCAY